MINSDQKSLNKIINILSIILIIVGFYFLFRKGDWSKVVGIKDNISYWGLAGVLALFTLSQFLMIVRWYLLLIPIKEGITLKSVFRIAISAMVLNQTAPGKVGYPTKAYFLKKAEDVPISSSIPSLFGEVFLDYSITGLFLLAAVFIGGYFKTIFDILGKHIDWNHIWLVPLLLILILLIFLILKQKLSSSNIFKNILAAFRLTRRRNDIIIKSIVLTMIALFIWFICDYLLLASLGYKLPLNFLIFVGAFTNILVLLAPLPGGLGVREISGAYLFKLFYNLGEIAVIMVLLSRLFSLIGLVILYVIDWLVRLHTKNKSVMEKISNPEISAEKFEFQTYEN
jgi:uncharacterized membrane protein YbhN (UPF0104 family)